MVIGILIAIALTSMTGAVTALGDTIFPVGHGPLADGSVLARVQQDLSAAQHFLVRLRIVHPVVAVTVAFAIYFAAGWIDERAEFATTRRFARGLRHGVAAQVVVGALNIGLAAPGWMQLVHLLLAQAVWICAVLLAACWGSEEPVRG